MLDYDSIAGYLGCHRSHRLADGGHVARRCIFHRRGIDGERLCELCALLGEFRARRPKRVLGKLLRRFAGAERGSRVSQGLLHRHHDRVRPPKHAPRGPFGFLERRHGLAEIVERGAVVVVERPRVTP